MEVTEQPQSFFGIIADDLRLYEWQMMIDQHPEKECRDFVGVFESAAKNQEEAGDDRGKRVFSFLSAISSCCSNYDDKGNPYRPRAQWIAGSRTFIPDDLIESDLTTMKGILEETSDPEFRARIGDILWVRCRDYSAAQVAIKAYIESADRFENDEYWPSLVERLKRAAQLAAMLGFGKAHHIEVVSKVEAVIARHESRLTSGALCARLIHLLLSQGQGDMSQYGALSERLAQSFIELKEWHHAEEYFEVAEQCYRKAAKEIDGMRCRLGLAETLIAKAEDKLIGENPQLGFAAHWMGQGVEALRRAKADTSRIAEIHARFLELQRAAVSEMKPIEVDFGKIPSFEEARSISIEKSQELVRGQSFDAALGNFVGITAPTNVEVLRSQVEKQSKQNIVTQLFGTVAIDHSGRVTDTAPATSANDPSVNDEAIFKQMLQNAARVNWPMNVDWKIEPSRLLIVSEHPVRLSDLSILVDNNPFIPEGHEGIFARGIQAGFFGDWLVAMHLLVPQLEASVRQVLQQHGVITSKLDSDGTQDERDLGWLLTHQKMEEVFGKDITFDLRGILIERFGYNLRNVMAHGLLPEGGFYQAAAVYLWWVIIHLCWIGYLSQQRGQETG